MRAAHTMRMITEDSQQIIKLMRSLSCDVASLRGRVIFDKKHYSFDNSGDDWACTVMPSAQ